VTLDDSPADSVDRLEHRLAPLADQLKDAALAFEPAAGGRPQTAGAAPGLLGPGQRDGQAGKAPGDSGARAPRPRRIAQIIRRGNVAVDAQLDAVDAEQPLQERAPAAGRRRLAATTASGAERRPVRRGHRAANREQPGTARHVGSRVRPTRADLNQWSAHLVAFLGSSLALPWLFPGSLQALCRLFPWPGFRGPALLSMLPALERP
jgi:hypothetical protein